MPNAPKTITQAAEAQHVEAKAENELAAWEHELEIWFQDLRAEFAHLDTAAHNKLFRAKEALKARLRGIIA